MLNIFLSSSLLSIQQHHQDKHFSIEMPPVLARTVKLTCTKYERDHVMEQKLKVASMAV